jgi:hypothetical protein
LSVFAVKIQIGRSSGQESMKLTRRNLFVGALSSAMVLVSSSALKFKRKKPVEIQALGDGYLSINGWVVNERDLQAEERLT